METAGQVAELVSGFLVAEEPWLVAVRRHLHAHPELGNAEHRTTELVRNRLASAGLTPKELSAAAACSATSGSATAHWWRCGPTWTRCRWRTRRTCLTARPCPAFATPAATTSTRPPCSARASRSLSSPTPGGCPVESG